MSDIVLASASPRRRELLAAAGVAFQVIPSTAEEATGEAGHVPADLVRENAHVKAAEVAARVDAAFVIGADTVVVLDGHVLGKPADRSEAAGVIRALQGRDHIVLTGLVVVDCAAGIAVDTVEETTVRFGPLSDAAAAAYLNSFDPLDKAGAYAIQGTGGLVIEAVYGCYYNVVGLPLHALERLFQRLGRSLLSESALRQRA